MSTQEQLKAIRQKCVEANREIVAPHWSKPHEGVPLFQSFDADDGKLYRPIHLADVLLAANHIKLWLWVTEQGRFNLHPQGGEIATGPAWNLRADSLDQQSPETIAFLHSLLL